MEVRGRRGRSQLEEENLEDGNVVPAPTGSWIVAFGVFLIHLNIPSFIFSYGVLLLHLRDESDGLLPIFILPPFFFVASWFITDPVCRSAVSGHASQAKYLAISAVLLVTLSIAINIYLQSTILLITYGILGGMGTSLLLSQAGAVLSSHFPSQRGMVQGVCHVGMALGHFGMPLILNGLISRYGIAGGLLLQSGIVLQAAIGAALLMSPEDCTPQVPYHARPRAYSLIDDIELADMSFSYSHSGHSPLLPQRSWRNPGVSSTDSRGYSSPIMQVRHKNINGVDILPEIPEENEESDDSSSSSAPSTPIFKARVVDSDDIDIGGTSNSEQVGKVYSFKKNKQSLQKSSLSKWQSVNLQSQRNAVSHTQNRKSANGNTVLLETNSENLIEELHTSSIPSENNSNRSLKSLLPQRISDQLRYYHSPFHKMRRKMSSCCCCHWYCRFRFYVAVLTFPRRAYKFTFRPLWIAVKEPKFIPALCLHTVSRINFVMFSALTPFLVWKRISTSSLQETVFPISVSAFTWLCFLIFSPCLSNLKPRKQKYVYFIGCLVSMSGLYLLSASRSHSSIIISCAIYGLGHGAIRNSGPIFLEDEFGTRKFLAIQGSLDGVSGCLALLLAIITSILLQYPDGINQSIISLAVLQSVTGLLLFLSTAIPFINRRLLCQRNVPCWPPENDFMTPG